MHRIRETFASAAITPLAYVDTYGCQQNESDSEKLRGMLCEMGYAMTDDTYAADIVVINTCAIRENAENRVYGNIGELIHTKTAKRTQIIVLCGCMAGIPKVTSTIHQSYKHVDLVFPPQSLWLFPELLYAVMFRNSLDTAPPYIESSGRLFFEGDTDGVIAEGLPAMRDGAIKAWLPVMYGCDNYCSYCIVPYVRGRERSRTPDAVLDEARSLVANGYKDITLLGQNVNSYGRGLKTSGRENGYLIAPTIQFAHENESHITLSKDTTDFASLLRQINDIKGDFLIRFMTSHPKDASESLFRAMAESEKIAKHIHLPFQAGNDRILRLMNRGYTKAEYLQKVALARSYMPDIVITSDVIVGFPGETDEEFEDTLRLIEEARFDAMFTFIFSKRPGTPAAALEDNVSREQKQVRFDRLINLQNVISEEKHSQYIGKTLRVLVDEYTDDKAHPLRARTNGGRLVHLSGDTGLVGGFIEAKITHCSTWSLFGEAL